MQAIIKYIASTSGCSIIITIDTFTYIFGLFEGFQRYYIEKGLTIKSINTIFITKKEEISPLCGLFLTLRDMGKSHLNIVCNKDLQFIISKTYFFCQPNSLKLNFISNLYIDRNIIVSNNFKIEIKDIKGRLLVEKIPKDLPKFLYKDFKNKKIIIFENKKYYAQDYMENDIKLNTIYIINDNIFENINTNSYIFCYKKQDYNRYKSFCKNTFLLSVKKNVDYISQFKLLNNINKINSDFLLPYFKKNIKLKKIYISIKIRYIRKFKFLKDGDHFVYNSKQKGFKLKKNKNENFKTKKNIYVKNSILFLGTGCAIPSKYRNVSGILLNLQNKFILLDCGEDTINQIYRISGSYKIIDKLDLIFISHSHADHCLGIINVLIKVMGPSIVLNFLKILFNNLTLIYTDELKLIEKNYDINKKNEKDCIKIFKFDYYVEICGCLHNVDSCSISIKDENYKISYSGDSRPSPLFCYISKNADVMIHECTFDDENKANAYKTLHSTLKEAENIFTLSQSKKLLLTHFSQRFPKKFDQKTIGIPCYDFYRHVIGKSEYDSCNFVNYFETLE